MEEPFEDEPLEEEPEPLEQPLPVEEEPLLEEPLVSFDFGFLLLVFLGFFLFLLGFGFAGPHFFVLFVRRGLLVDGRREDLVRRVDLALRGRRRVGLSSRGPQEQEELLLRGRRREDFLVLRGRRREDFLVLRRRRLVLVLLGRRVFFAGCRRFGFLSFRPILHTREFLFFAQYMRRYFAF